jgi:DNA-binding CsgD family transcriptional regulator
MLLGREVETEALQRLISEARAGVSGALVLVGDAGMGKTALLRYAESAGVGMEIARAVGVQPEVDIPYAGLHQLLLPFLGELDRIPGPHGDALRSAFGLASSTPRDRFFVGMAALSVLSHAAAQQPVLCLIDEAEQLDRASIDALGFAARRMLADRVAMIFAVRLGDEPLTALQGLSQMKVSGLDDDAAHTLLAAAAGGQVDPWVADRIVSETAGQPLAIVELVREFSREQLEGLAPLPELLPLGRRLEDVFAARLRALPSHMQTLYLLAAADPSGDSRLFWRAAEQGYGLSRSSTDISGVEEFASCSPRIRFHHPLMRSAAYYRASGPERRRAHEALAAASDPVRDSDLRAWHRAAAAIEPDERIASGLERAANRARRRGGWASAAVLLERAAELTPGESNRARRALACAHARLLANQPGAARAALKQALPGLTDTVSRCQALRLQGAIDFISGRSADASASLATAAQMCMADNPREARDTLIEAFDAAHLAGEFADVDCAEVLRMVRSLSPTGEGTTVADALLEGFAALMETGDAAGVPILRRALELATARPIADEDLRWLPIAWITAPELYDDRAWQALTSRWSMAARTLGPVNALPIGLSRISHFDVIVGRYAAAERGLAEARELAAATGGPARPASHTVAELGALAWRGHEREARIAAAALVGELTRSGRGLVVRVVNLSMAWLELGLGNYREALRAARYACAGDPLLHLNAEPELIEAAVRCGEIDSARVALERLTARAHACGTDWARGLMLRSQALLAERQDAEQLYVDAIEHLGRCLVKPQLGRAHLVYGEWLRRQRRRRDAREQLRTAFDLLSDLGADAFAERARNELLATGEHVRKREAEALGQLTPQEEQIARLASEGASNTDIAIQLFISVPTVAYHLQKTFRKLDVANRTSLARALSDRSMPWTAENHGTGGSGPTNGAVQPQRQIQGAQ